MRGAALSLFMQVNIVALGGWRDAGPSSIWGKGRCAAMSKSDDLLVDIEFALAELSDEHRLTEGQSYWFGRAVHRIAVQSTFAADEAILIAIDPSHPRHDNAPPTKRLQVKDLREKIARIRQIPLVK